jgi:hypothetical protein
MSGNLPIGILLIIAGALGLYSGLYRKHTLHGLKFRLISVGIAAIIVGLFLIFN